MAFQRHSSSSPVFAIMACFVWMFLLLVLGGGALVMVVFAVEHGVTSNHLRVSIRNNHLLQDSPSCQHSIGQVELLNLHPTDHIQIRSIRTTTERTEVILPSTDDVLIVGEGDYSSSLASQLSDHAAAPACLQLPLQLHAVVSSDDGGSDNDSIVTLGPGQVVMVPIALLPRFPPPPLSPSLVGGPTTTASHSSSSTPSMRIVEESPPLSKYQIADWNDIMEEDESDDDGAADTTTPRSSDRRRRTRRRNNFLRPEAIRSNDTQVERYLVSTTILVDTDRGTVEVPLEVSSVRENEYGLPDTLYFDVGDDEEETSAASPQENIAENDEESERIREALRLIKQAKERDNNRRRTIPTSDQDLYLVERQTRRRLPSPSQSLSEAPSATAQFDDDDDDSPAPDCFDVYVDTAGSTSFQVTQVSVSRPDRVTLHTLQDDTLSAPLSRIDAWVSATVFDDMDDFLHIPADDERHYVVTVCAGGGGKAHNDDVPSEAPSLQSDDIPDWMDDDGSDPANANDTATDRSTSLGILQVKTSRGPLYIALEKAQGELLDYLRYPPPRSIRSSQHSAFPASHEEQHEPPLQSSPSAIDITFYGSSIPSKSIPIHVSNADTLTGPFTVMRGSVVLDTDVSGLLDIRLVEVQPDTLTLECTWSQKTTEAHTIHGAVILRGTSLPLAYGEWKELLDDPSTDLIEIPLKITILPNARLLFVQNDAPQEDMFFPSNPSLAGTSSHASAPEHVFRVVAKSSHSTLDVATMTLHNVEVVPEKGAVNPALCQRFNVTSSDPTRKNDLGTIFVRYRIPKDATFDNGGLPTMCLVRVETYPDAGIHHLELMVYSGQVSISSVASWPHARKEKQRTIAGLSDLVDWFRNTKAGYSLRSVIKSSVAPESVDRDSASLTRYLLSLAGIISREDWMSAVLHPVLLNAGAISQGEVETIPVFVANNNPIPLTISIDVGEVEGMGIELGRDEVGSGAHVLDFLPSRGIPQRATVGRFQGHPVAAMERFLSESQPARAFFQKLPYREDVFPNFAVLQRFPLLERKYRSYGAARLRRDKVPFRLSQFGWNECDSATHPPSYGAFRRKLDQGVRRLPGPIIISSDRKTLRTLKKCWYAKGEPKHLRTDESKVLIPPGGVARFDVKLLAPPSSVLEKDITQFITTGLVMSTDIGETISVAATFDALQGNLEVSHIPSAPYHSDIVEEEADGAIMVPVGLFGSVSVNASSSIKIPPQAHQSVADFTSARSMIPRNISTVETGISLFMKSSFYREIRLRKVISCNPWFEVSLANDTDNANFDPFLGVHIGAVSNMVSCDPIMGVPDNITSFPSFYRCALSWVTRRLELQPKGCSTQTRDSLHDSAANGETNKKFQHLVRTLRRAIIISEWMDSLSTEETNISGRSTEPIKSGRRGPGGVVSPLLLDSMVAAWDEMHRASDAGLLKLGTSLQALVEYESTPEELSPVSLDAGTEEDNSHLLSLAIRNVSIASALKTPSLLNTPNGYTKQGIPCLNFPPTRVSAVSTLMIPIRNPTAVPVRIRLAVSNRLSTDKDYDGPLSDFDPPFIHGHNREEHGPLLDANVQWWERAGAYVSGDYTGDVIRSDCNLTVSRGFGASVSFMNPSFDSSSAFLVGCGNRCGLRTETQAITALESRKSSSPIGASAAAGTAIYGSVWPGGKRSSFPDGSATMAAAGNLIGGLKGPSPFAIPYSSFDEVIVPPFTEATLGPVLFRPPGRSKRLGCAALRGQKKQDYCENQSFETTVFLENSLSGLEPILLRGTSVWDSVAVFSSEEGDVEVKNGRETLVFPGYSDTNSPVVKEFVLHNDGDSEVVLDRPRVLRQRAQTRRLTTPCETGGNFRVLECYSMFPLVLQPGQNSTVKVAHFPQCRKRQEHISIAFAMRNVGEFAKPRHENGSINPDVSLFSIDGSNLLRKKQINLVFGYEMSTEDLKFCKRIQSSLWVEEDHAKDTSVNSTNSRGRARLLRQRAKHHIGTGSVLAVAATCVIGFAVLMLSNRIKVSGACLSKHQSDPRLRGWEMHTMCLAKADPLPTELQHIGRERSQEIMHARFQLMKSTVPQSLRRSVLLGRDGSGVSNHVGAAGNKKRRGTGSERVRTSEGIFGHYHAGSVDDQGKLPLQLGWRVAGSRGIITPSSFDEMSLVLETQKLVEDRRTQSRDHTFDVQTGGSKPNSLNESLASSYDELTDEDDIPQQAPTSSVNTRFSAALPTTIETRSSSGKNLVVETPDIGWTDARAKNKASSRLDGTTFSSSNTKKVPKKNSVRNENHRIASSSPVDFPVPAIASLSSQAPVRTKKSDTVRHDLQDLKCSAKTPNKAHNVWNGSKERDESIGVSVVRNESTLVTDTKSPGGLSRARQQTAETSSRAWRTNSPNLQSISTPPTPSRSVVIPESPSHATDGSSSPVSEHAPTPSNMRPPPGLGPPPGFGTGVPFLTPPVSELPTLDAISTNDMLLSSSTFMNTPLQPALFDDASPLVQHSNVKTEEEPSMKEFDVMDFLDDILDEGNPTTAPHAVPSNPWATTESRAAAYGIPIDWKLGDEEQNEDDD